MDTSVRYSMPGSCAKQRLARWSSLSTPCMSISSCRRLSERRLGEGRIFRLRWSQVAWTSPTVLRRDAAHGWVRPITMHRTPLLQQVRAVRRTALRGHRPYRCLASDRDGIGVIDGACTRRGDHMQRTAHKAGFRPALKRPVGFATALLNPPEQPTAPRHPGCIYRSVLVIDHSAAAASSPNVRLPPLPPKWYGRCSPCRMR